MLLDFGSGFSSEKLRQQMVSLKLALADLLATNHQESLQYAWLGRFDQQRTTRFHLDNAADQSFLMLGYEPSSVRSSLAIADYSRFAEDQGISTTAYFERYDPLQSKNDQHLESYTSAVDGFSNEHYQILLFNNSNGIDEQGTKGVLHRAIIHSPDNKASRVVNSMMLQLQPSSTPTTITEEDAQRFIKTQLISR